MLDRCKYCNGLKVQVMTTAKQDEEGLFIPQSYYVECPDCHTRTGEFSDDIIAVSAWLHKEVI